MKTIQEMSYLNCTLGFSGFIENYMKKGPLMKDSMQKWKNKTTFQICDFFTAYDWNELIEDDVEEFVGYDQLEAEVRITRWRKVENQSGEFYQLVFQATPFYAESGGQVGDTGYLENQYDKVEIVNTKKENNLIVHFTKELPKYLELPFTQ